MHSLLIHGLEISAAFAGGFVGAIAGGGGLVLLPALLLAGVPTPMILGTNKMLSVFTTLPSAVIYIKKLKINLRDWYAAIIFTAMGAIISVFLVKIIPQHVMHYFLAILLISSSLYMVVNDRKNNKSIDNSKNSKSYFVKNSCCFGISCFSGILGAGSGILWTNMLVSLFKLDIFVAVGMARLLSFISNITAFAFYAKYGLIDFNLGIQMCIAVVMGAYIGAHLAVRINKKLIKLIMFFVSIMTSMVLIF